MDDRTAVGVDAQSKSNASVTPTSTSSKTLKRCLSVPIMHNVPGASVRPFSTMTTRSAAAAAAINRTKATNANGNGSGNGMTITTVPGTTTASAPAEHCLETPKKYQNLPPESFTSSTGNHGIHVHINIPRSNPSSREVSPAPVFNIFAPRARRYSASYTHSGNSAHNTANGTPLCLTPRVSQLRQEECVDINSREVNHEREVHSAMQMSQSWEDLTLVAENWSCKSDEFSNPLQVVLPSGSTSCSSPSPTSTRTGLRRPCVLSPSPTRRTFATRRSMSPIAMRPSQLGPVKRKFELDDSNSSNWNVYSPAPLKKIFTESRGSSPSSVCPSPDSGTYDGRITPKLFVSKLCTTNNHNSSTCSSPMSSSPSSAVIDAAVSASSASSVSGGSEPMSLSSNIDEGISISEPDDKMQTGNVTDIQPMSTDMQDDATLMDDLKSETSSIGGCSSISMESSSCDSGSKSAPNFLNKLALDDMNAPSQLSHKSFFINKQGVGGAKKYIVNHDNLPNSGASEHGDNIKVLSSASNPSGDGSPGDGGGIVATGESNTRTLRGKMIMNQSKTTAAAEAVITENTM